VLLVCKMYSEIALSRKPFGIGHMYIYIFLLRMADTVTSQNIDLSSWDTLYNSFSCCLDLVLQSPCSAADLYRDPDLDLFTNFIFPVTKSP
jgi:hypothetical protein